jgi:hypothetical protein
VVGILFGTMFGLPNNAYATCVNYIQSQTIAAAYEGDAEPTVHTMDTCGGDDTSYQIPIATTITFDGVQYSNVYATTNSVITFGNPDNTYWDYPQTPSISLYSMDWVSGWYNAPDTLNIMYSEGGFQLDLEVIPFGQWNAPTPSNINIIVAITNTGGISVAYSYQGPEYPNLRTGVRLHNGDIVSLEAWGATQIEAGEPIPTLEAEPIPEPSPTPTEDPITPEEQQVEVAQATQLADQITDLNFLIASINGDPIEDVVVIPDPEPTVTPEEPDLPEPDVEVDPEIIDEDDPRFPDNDEQTQPEEATPSPDSDSTDEGNEDLDPDSEPSEEPAEDSQPQQEDTDQGQGNEQVPNLPDSQGSSDNNSIDNGISEEELKKLNKLISVNDAKLLTQLVGQNESIKQAVEEFTERAEENADAPMPYTIADATVEVQAEKFLEDPIGAILSVDLETVLSPTEWGKDMTDDQREKAQEVIIPVILVSNIVNSVMSLRRL